MIRAKCLGQSPYGSPFLPLTTIYYADTVWKQVNFVKHPNSDNT